MKLFLLIAIVLALVSSTMSCIPTQPPALTPAPESTPTPEPTEDEVITTPSATRIEKLPFSWTEGIMLYTMELVEGEGYWQADRWDYYELRLDYQNTSHETTSWKLRVGEFKLKSDVGNVYGLESGGLHASDVAPEGDGGFVAVVFKVHQGEIPVELWWYRQGGGQEEPDIIFKLETAPTLTPAPTPALTPAPSPAPTTVPTTDELEVHFINVGQGDSILIDLGKIEILIDGGGKSPGVVTYLNDYVDGAIEVMVATHPHADHIGGLIAVLDVFEVEEIWLNGDTSTSKTYQEFMSRVNAENASMHEALRGQSIEVDGLTLHVLHPTKPLVGDINNNSIVLRLSYGDIDFLFTGDTEKEAEASILEASLVVRAQILKVGHHGSSSSSSPKFLNAVKPEIAIYMAGEGNRYGHPHDETLAALNEVGAEKYGTDVYGTIIVTTEGKSYTLQVEKQASPRAPPIVSPTPAKFTVNNLAISPIEVEPEETVTISATLTNSGGSTGTHIVVLKVNGAELATKSVTLDAGESQKISFTATTPYSGIYRVEVDGLEDTFTVIKKVIQEQDLSLEIVSVTSPIGKGYTATLKAKTLPEANCDITVYYKSGPSGAAGLYPKEADNEGNVSWSWKVGTRTTPGSWRIVVTASLDGKTASQTTYFTVY